MADETSETPETPADSEPRSARLPSLGALSHRLSHWLAPAALLVALVAVVLASWALMSAPSDGPAAAKQAGDPKTRVCVAFRTVDKAVSLQTHTELGRDPVREEAVAANARLALVGGGQYLLSNLDSATPGELADAVRAFARHLQDIGVNALAGVSNSNPEQSARLIEGDSLQKQIADLCK
jgi:hypothetical protein